jgi:hypothetical protein
MTRTPRLMLGIAIAGLFGICALMVSEQALVGRSASVVTTADARIGRPLTPMSYAGVARRTTRRAVAAGAAVAAPVVVAPVVVAPRCVQAVDAYGRIYTRCY